MKNQQRLIVVVVVLMLIVLILGVSAVSNDIKKRNKAEEGYVEFEQQVDNVAESEPEEDSGEVDKDDEPETETDEEDPIVGYQNYQESVTKVDETSRRSSISYKKKYELSPDDDMSDSLSQLFMAEEGAAKVVSSIVKQLAGLEGYDISQYEVINPSGAEWDGEDWFYTVRNTETNKTYDIVYYADAVECNGYLK